MEKIMRGISAFNKWMAKLVGWVIFAMMLIITYDVTMRYIFKSPTTWSFEVSTYMLVAIVFLGGAWTLPAGGHVSVDIVTERVKPKTRAIMGIITSVLAIVYLVIFSLASFDFTREAVVDHIRSTQYLGWPLWPVRSFLLLGGIMLLLEFIFRLIRFIKLLKEEVSKRQ